MPLTLVTPGTWWKCLLEGTLSQGGRRVQKEPPVDEIEGLSPLIASLRFPIFLYWPPPTSRKKP